MTLESYKKQFRERATKIGYSEEEIFKCLTYAEPLLEKDLPVIFNTANLSALVGYNKNYLKRAALYTSSYYRNFAIKKKNGTLRQLKEPLPSLKEIQDWILKHILYKIPVSRFAKAYIPNRDILDNVRYHRKKQIVVGLDIVNFFSSIKRVSVESIFLKCGYSSNVSNLLSKLCCCDEILPQGAPTSPCLSNIFMKDFDTNIFSFCESKDIRFTRYADDLTFSGDLIINDLLTEVEKELNKMGLELNQLKTRVMWPSQRQIVTGIVVNREIQLPKTQRKKIRQEVHFLIKFGLVEHLQKINNTKENYLLHLLGKIIYALRINPKDEEMKKYKDTLNAYLAFGNSSTDEKVS